MTPGKNDLDLQLQRHFGFTSFRSNQRDIVEAILAGRDVFAALPTGGGKSLCYQLPALLIPGIAVVVSPLIALMKDQVDAAQRIGIPATFLNSSLDPSESRERWKAVASGRMRLLYVSPERITNEAFRQALCRFRLSFIAIDEAHCISEWGHEFRPDYRALRLLRKELPSLPLAGFTATATKQVQKDVVSLLGLEDPLVVRASFNRPEIFYRVVEKHDVHRQIHDFVSRHDGEPGIVYRATRKDTELTAGYLARSGIAAKPYHAGMSDEARRATQEAFLAGQLQAVVATIAFGMGIDKSDVRWVVHGDLPRSIEGYYQETGRAARDGKPAETVLLYSPQDIAKIRWHIGKITWAGERTRAERRLSTMLHYVESTDCRRKVLLRHFDEAFRGDCDACDVCKGELETEDLTELSQMILSAAVRTGERFGAHHLVDIVTGNPTDKVLERGHNGLPTFGVGAGRDRGFWLSLVRDLAAAGHLVRGDGDRAGFRLSQQGRLLLAGKSSFIGRARASATARPAAPRKTRSHGAGAGGPLDGKSQEEEGSGLYLALKEMRKRSAATQGVPAFVIFSDRTLRAIAAARPRSASALLACHGVGARKLEQYGEMVLEVVRAFESGKRQARNEIRPL